MMAQFSDRREAGRQLAKALAAYKGRADVLVMALPRGGVAVGVEVAKALGLPLDLMLVRKLGVPGDEELAMGALAMGDVRFLNEEIVRMIQISKPELEAVIAREREELRRRNDVYRGGKDVPELKGRTVILVDDGIATGADMRASVRAARQLGASSVIVAVPVCSDSAYAMLEKEADEVVSLMVPQVFFGVGSFFGDFSQMDDEEVIALMAEARHQTPRNAL